MQPPVSGILHYPTGAGKTRVAMELIARALKDDPEHRFVWATARRSLVRQSMIRMTELERLFPNDTTFSWSQSADDIEVEEEDIKVWFMTRANLTDVLERAADGRRKSHPWRRRLEDGKPMTLIYDECHQLGARKLQSVWRKFHEQLVNPGRGRQRAWRTIGLSATPVPTQQDSHRVIGECIFPPRREGPRTNHDWPFHVFHRVPNEALVEANVLCPINTSLDDSGYFDIPPDVLRTVSGERNIEAPGPGADAWDVDAYTRQCNRGVMSDPRVLTFLAERLGRRLPVLGKTVVFVPTIDAANRLASLLHEGFAELRGAIATVHDKLRQVQSAGQVKADVHQILKRFHERGTEPCLLINVDMLTEGFDDPKIKTVVLARLTLSTNRFWQMIGRGTRGPAAGGTTECNVIDPVKLVRLYDYFGGYQPDVRGTRSVELEGTEAGEEQDAPGGGALAPEVPVAARPPDPASCPYAADPELSRIHGEVAVALQAFLAGRSISERSALDMAKCVRVDLSEGRPLLRAAEGGAFDGSTAMALLLGEIARLEERAEKELSWFRRQLPAQLSEALLVQRLRALRAIESLGLWTESTYAEALTTGAFLTVLQQEAAGAGVAPTEGVGTAGPQPATHASQLLSPAEQAIVDAAVALLQSDQPSAMASFPERVSIANTLRELFGTKPTEALNSLLSARTVAAAVPFELLKERLNSDQRQRFLRDMADLALSSRSVSPARLDFLLRFSAALAIPKTVTDAILGHQANDVAVTPDSRIRCLVCSSELPAVARFCPGCGSAVRSGVGCCRAS